MDNNDESDYYMSVIDYYQKKESDDIDNFIKTFQIIQDKLNIIKYYLEESCTFFDSNSTDSTTGKPKLTYTDSSTQNLLYNMSNLIVE